MSETMAKEWSNEEVFSKVSTLFSPSEHLRVETLILRVEELFDRAFDDDTLYWEFLCQTPEDLVGDDLTILNQVLTDPSYWGLVGFDVETYSTDLIYQYVTFDFVNPELLLKLLRAAMGDILSHPSNKEVWWEDLLYKLDYSNLVLQHWDTFKDLQITNVQVKKGV